MCVYVNYARVCLTKEEDDSVAVMREKLMTCVCYRGYA